MTINSIKHFCLLLPKRAEIMKIKKILLKSKKNLKCFKNHNVKILIPKSKNNKIKIFKNLQKMSKAFLKVENISKNAGKLLIQMMISSKFNFKIKIKLI